MTKPNRGYLAVGLAGLAYLIAVTQRTTMGSVALDASTRFHTNAQQLSSLAVMQLVFYAAMQVPVGILLDRFGSRKLLASGAVLMAIGQVVVGLSDALPTAIVGRILVGVGDACTFISMMRMSNSWFSGQIASHLQQWLATIGQTGQILSAIPFAMLLHMTSWESAFVSASALSLLISVVVWVFANENPAKEIHHSVKLTDVFAKLRSNTRRPVTWLAFFTHFTTQSTGTTFALLWGVPFMVSALALPRATAGGFLTLFVITNASMGPLIGLFCARFPKRRQWFVLGVVASIVTVWLLVVSHQGVTPIWLLTALVMIIGVGGPSSMISFDYSKEAFSANELGATNGLINVGGFLASLTMMWIVGLSLDLQGGANLYTLEHFRVAFALQLVVTGIGLVGFLFSWRSFRNTFPSKTLL
jgi:MFS family permease